LKAGKVKWQAKVTVSIDEDLSLEMKSGGSERAISIARSYQSSDSVFVVVVVVVVRAIYEKVSFMIQNVALFVFAMAI